MKNENKQAENYWRARALGLFFRLSSWIVGPILAAIIIGRWLDRKYQTAPWLFLAAIAIAFGISIYGMVKDAIKEIKKIDEEKK